ncbi:MAG TPA: hypothetical protein VGQ52_13760 [Gemmatimonadaceae bacterium]|jgi:hypothetical protein|nr:hypothetical protein [Gemmatimonadaceae bacterium]
MKFREHRGMLVESMETTVDVPDRPALIKHLQNILQIYYIAMQPDDLTVEPYGGTDARTGWDTYIVIVRGFGVIGFTDGPVS